jgi:microcystin-dependent protein
MATGSIAPSFWTQIEDANGAPLAGGLIYSYSAGTTTPIATWSDVGLTTPNSNPIVLDSAGRATIFLSVGVSYKFVVQTALGVAVRTADNILGLPLSTTTISGGTAGQVLTSTGPTSIASFQDVPAAILTGDIVPSAARTRTGCILCNGTAVSRNTYSTLFTTIVPTIGTATITLATPAVVTSTAHGLIADDTVYFTTSGALPTGLSINTLYFVIAAGLTANAFELSATSGGAAINTSGSQSGVQTLTYCPFGLGDGTTTFNVPNIPGRAPIGAGAGSGLTARALGRVVGEETHALTAAENGPHTHDVAFAGASGSGPRIGGTATANDSTATTTSSGSGTGHNTMQPSIALNWFIKT